MEPSPTNSINPLPTPEREQRRPNQRRGLQNAGTRVLRTPTRGGHPPPLAPHGDTARPLPALTLPPCPRGGVPGPTRSPITSPRHSESTRGARPPDGRRRHNGALPRSRPPYLAAPRTAWGESEGSGPAARRKTRAGWRKPTTDARLKPLWKRSRRPGTPFPPAAAPVTV